MSTRILGRTLISTVVAICASTVILTSAGSVLGVPKPEITSIDPDRSPRDVKVHITNLAGTGFVAGAGVWLQKTGEADIPAERVVVESATKITCDIELAATALGYWDVVVENPLGLRDTLESGFLVEDGFWSDELRLTNAEGISTLSKPNARCIAVDSGDNVHVVWEDKRAGSYGLYYKKYDGTWSADQPLVSESSDARYPALAVGGGDVLHVVWEDDRDGHPEVYYKYYDGLWSSDQRFTNSTYGSGYPSVATFGDSIHVVWQGRETMYPDIYYRCHDGTSWGPDHEVSFGYGHNDILPSVAAGSEGLVHVVWSRLNTGDLYYRFFDGAVWKNPKIIGHDNLDGAASMTLDSDEHLHVAWHGLDGEIYYRWRSVFGAWQPEQRLTHDDGASHNTSVVVDADGNVHIPFVDDRTGNREIYCITYDGVSWEPEVRLTNDPAESRRPSAAVDSQGQVHLIYRDGRFDSQEIVYRMRSTSPTSGVDPEMPADLSDFCLRFMPNPVQAAGEISFALPRLAGVRLAIFNISGRLVWSRDLGLIAPGIHHVAWDGADQAGKPVAQGIYLLRLLAGAELTSAKIVVLR
jgi:hypothetical protein